MSRKKRVLQALGLEDEFDALFEVKPKGRAPGTLPSENPLAVQLQKAARKAAQAATSKAAGAPKPKPTPKAALLDPEVPRETKGGTTAQPLDMAHEARMARAREMGFDVENPLYVSMLNDVTAFDPHGRFRGHKGISGISLTDNPELASRYLDRYGDFDYKNEPFSKQMMRVFIRPGAVESFDRPIPSQYTLGAPLPENYEWPPALDDVDTAIFPDAVSRKGRVRHLDPGTKNAIQGLEYILRDPTRVRSFTAAFDPQYFDSPDLMKARGGLAVKRKKR